jgi:hypothetical protein
MTSLYFLAHAGEQHENETQTFLHVLTSSWYSVPLVVLFGALIVLIVYAVSKRSLTATVTAAQFVLLFGGITLFQLMPILSVLCIVCGFTLSLVVVINGLRSGHDSKAQ